MIFSESEEAWLKRRAEKIARENGEPLPIARSIAMRELVRMQQNPKAEVVPLTRKAPQN